MQFDEHLSNISQGFSRHVNYCAIRPTELLLLLLLLLVSGVTMATDLDT